MTQPATAAVRPAAKRNREMDGFRGIATLLVLHQHWFISPFNFGAWALVLFFVLSGYLITRSLFSLLNKNLGTWRSARIFFVRRLRRLFPAYYLVLLIGVVLLPDLRQEWPWYALYGSNILIALRQDFVPYTPTWSLAVEEQFYIVWFLAFALLPRTAVIRGLGAAVVFALVFRIVVLAAGQPLSTFLLPGSLDGLAMGCLLAFAERASWTMPPWAGPAALACAVAALVSNWVIPVHDWFGGSVWQVLIGLSSVWLVWRSRTGLGGWAGALFGSRIAAYLGRISYGIYLFHMLTGKPAKMCEAALGLGEHSILGFVIQLALTIPIAALSFRFLEEPILEGTAAPVLQWLRDRRDSAHDQTTRV